MSNFRIYNDVLCPDLWDSTMHIDLRIRSNLLQMAYDFYEKTQLLAPIVDVYLMGSGANYNWTPDSDVDVHVIIDYSKLQMPNETAVKTVKTDGAQWNSEHNVFIKGHKVEMNLQNSQEQKKYVTGIYSLVNDQWLRKPVKSPVQINKTVLKVQYEAMKIYIQNCIGSRDREQMKAAKKYLDAYRQYGLDNCGELSYENIIYKMLRARGYIKQLKDSIVSVYDHEMTVDEAGKTHVPKGYKVDDEFNCLTNAENLAKLNPQLKYVEGWARFPTKKWGAHAWCETKNGEVIDPYFQKLFGDKQKLIQYKKALSSEDPFDRGFSDIDEVGKRDIKQIHPKLSTSDHETVGSPEFDRSYWDKFNRSYEANLSRLTLDELKALREKARRLYTTSTDEEYKRLGKEDFEKYSLEIKRRLGYINQPVNESPMMTKKGSQALAGDKPLKGSSVTDVMGNIVVIRQPSDGGIIAKGYTLVYFMDSEQAANAMARGGIPYLMVPRGTFMGGGSPITDVWKKKFQKPGHEHILGLIEGHTDNDRIYVDMISVRPGWKRNHIAKLMIDRLKKSFEKAKVSTSTQTTDGEKLFKGLGVPKPSTNEGVGSGVPEDDRLKIKNTDGSTRRWQVRSKDAPKTPKFTGEEMITVPEYDEPQKCNDDISPSPNFPSVPSSDHNRVNLFPNPPSDEIPPNLLHVIKMAEKVLDRRSLRQDFFEVEYVEEMVNDLIISELPSLPHKSLQSLIFEIVRYLTRDFDIRYQGRRVGE